MSNPFKSTIIKGTKITDFGTTSAEIGIPLPFGYGRVVVAGNIIFAPMPPKESRQVRRQGKGGVKQETYTYTLSYAVAFLSGPCYGYLWIKRNGKIVWTQDPNATASDLAYAAKWAQKVNFYYGTPDQLPDSVIESYEGAGNVSAFKQLAYITVEDDDVTETGGAVPSYEACIIASPPELYFTSHPYAQMFADATVTSLSVIGGNLDQLLFDADLDDGVEVGIAPAAGFLVVVPPNEIVDDLNVNIAPSAGFLKVPASAYMYDATDTVMLPSSGYLLTPPLGTFKDNTDVSLTPVGGSLT